MPSKVITIDGPSASGKGTLAKLLSKQINFDLLDSGALYRAFAFFTNQGLSHEVITKKLSSISFVLFHINIPIHIPKYNLSFILFLLIISRAKSNIIL